MTPTITAEQRNLLYDEILNYVNGIGDVRRAVSQEDYEAAGRLGLIYADILRLVNEDLGWEVDGSAETIELKTPPDILRRVLTQIRDAALGHDAIEEEERAERRENEERNHLVVEACRQVLADLDVEQDDDDPAREEDRSFPRLAMLRIPRPGAIRLRMGNRRRRSP